MWIGGHDCMVFNTDAPFVLVLFHGIVTQVSEYYPLAQRLSKQGYAVLVPTDCNGNVEMPLCAPTWGKDVAAAARDWAGNRPVGLLGHSSGGGSTMAAAKSIPGIAAFVAMHPAPVLSGLGWDKVKGPILFTTGTYDDGTFGGNTVGATSPNRALQSYNDAEMPKALVNVKGNVHMSSLTASGDEWLAVTEWLECFVKRNLQSCQWVRTQMCTSPMLEWCFHYGVESAMQGVHV